MSAEVRAGVVDRLIKITLDDDLTDDEKIAQVFSDDIGATGAERMAAVERLKEIKRGELEALGQELSALGMMPVTEVVRVQPVLVGSRDTSMGQLRAIAAVWKIVSKWDLAQHPDRTLGDVLKVLPVEDHDAVLLLLGVKELT